MVFDLIFDLVSFFVFCIWVLVLLIKSKSTKEFKSDLLLFCFIDVFDKLLFILFLFSSSDDILLFLLFLSSNFFSF